MFATVVHPSVLVMLTMPFHSALPSFCMVTLLTTGVKQSYPETKCLTMLQHHLDCLLYNHSDHPVACYISLQHYFCRQIQLANLHLSPLLSGISCRNSRHMLIHIMIILDKTESTTFNQWDTLTAKTVIDLARLELSGFSSCWNSILLTAAIYPLATCK